MRVFLLRAAVLAAIEGGSGSAWAHEMRCTEQIEFCIPEASVCAWSSWVEVRRYPALLRLRFAVENTHATGTSVAALFESPLLAALGVAPPFAAPLTLAVGESTTGEVTVTIPSYERCAELAGGAASGEAEVCGAPASGAALDSRLVAVWDGGQAQCTARIVCHAEVRP